MTLGRHAQRLDAHVMHHLEGGTRVSFDGIDKMILVAYMHMYLYNVHTMLDYVRIKLKKVIGDVP